MKTFNIITLGCKVNQYDSEAISDTLESVGLTQVEPGIPADLCIVNTCTVTGVADRKSRQQLKRAVRANPNAQVVATGCAADNHPEMLAELTGVTHVISNRAKGRIPELLGLSEGPLPFGISKFGKRTRAFLKVQDGCECFCTYCIIPYVRGKVVSRSLDEIEDEAKRLVDSGHKEIVLTGVHIGSFGIDLVPRRSIADILDRLVPIQDLHRIRISSIEAREFSGRLLDQIARFPKLCPHFHIPLQSGSDRLLTQMKRRYRTSDLFEIVDRLSQILPEVSYTTDVIVGFPGETEEDFEQTLDTARRIGFNKIHIFPYSDRKGTPAVKMPNKCSPQVIADRRRRLAELERELALSYKERFLGRKVEVLTESQRDPGSGKLCGYTDRYLRVLFEGPDSLKNEFVSVTAHSIEPEVVHGELTVPAAKATGLSSLPVINHLTSSNCSHS